jgi:hypothetical protein
VAAALRTEILASTESLEVTQRRIALDGHGTAMAAVTAVRSTAWDVGLATEAQAAVAAGACRNEDPRSVVEHAFIVEQARVG